MLITQNQALLTIEAPITISLCNARNQYAEDNGLDLAILDALERWLASVHPTARMLVNRRALVDRTLLSVDLQVTGGVLVSMMSWLLSSWREVMDYGDLQSQLIERNGRNLKWIRATSQEFEVSLSLSFIVSSRCGWLGVGGREKTKR